MKTGYLGLILASVIALCIWIGNLIINVNTPSQGLIICIVSVVIGIIAVLFSEHQYAKYISRQFLRDYKKTVNHE